MVIKCSNNTRFQLSQYSIDQNLMINVLLLNSSLVFKDGLSSCINRASNDRRYFIPLVVEARMSMSFSRSSVLNLGSGPSRDLLLLLSEATLYLTARLTDIAQFTLWT